MSEVKRYTAGWLIFLSAFGVLLVEIGRQVEALQSWDQATQPAFVAKVLIQLGVAIAAFVGGKLIPAPGDRRNTFSRRGLHPLGGDILPERRRSVKERES